jgi:endo-1,4-beta-D-glucanase Y
VKYHQAVRWLIQSHASAIKDAARENTTLKWMAVSALAASHVMKKYSKTKFSSAEVTKIIMESIMHVISNNESTNVPTETIAASVAAVIASHFLLNQKCCQKFCFCAAAQLDDDVQSSTV